MQVHEVTPWVQHTVCMYTVCCIKITIHRQATRAVWACHRWQVLWRGRGCGSPVRARRVFAVAGTVLAEMQTADSQSRSETFINYSNKWITGSHVSSSENQKIVSSRNSQLPTASILISSRSMSCCRFFLIANCRLRRSTWHMNRRNLKINLHVLHF